MKIPTETELLALDLLTLKMAASNYAAAFDMWGDMADALALLDVNQQIVELENVLG